MRVSAAITWVTGLAGLALLLSPAAHADTIFMRDGHTLEGRVLSSNGETLELEVEYGTMRVPVRLVEKIEAETPEKKAAREEAEAGKREFEENMRAEGKVKYKGGWVTPEEKAAAEEKIAEAKRKREEQKLAEKKKKEEEEKKRAEEQRRLAEQAAREQERLAPENNGRDNGRADRFARNNDRRNRNDNYDNNGNTSNNNDYNRRTSTNNPNYNRTNNGNYNNNDRNYNRNNNDNGYQRRTR
jgi:outer membrane biosynthesis protein TonB